MHKSRQQRHPPIYVSIQDIYIDLYKPWPPPPLDALKALVTRMCPLASFADGATATSGYRDPLEVGGFGGTGATGALPAGQHTALESGRLCFREGCGPAGGSEAHSGHHFRVRTLRRVRRVIGVGSPRGLPTPITKAAKWSRLWNLHCDVCHAPGAGSDISSPRSTQSCSRYVMTRHDEQVD